MFLARVGVNMGRKVETWVGLEDVEAVVNALMSLAAILSNGEHEVCGF